MKQFIIVFCLAAILPISVEAQSTNTDSLSLAQVIERVIANYPSVKKAEIDVESSNDRINLIKAVYNPNLDFEANYSYLQPVSSMTIAGLGALHLYPSSNYSTSLNLNQQLYDFGKTSKSVELEKNNKALSELSLEQLKQSLSSSLLGNYYNIVYLQEAIKIKNEELNNLNDHLAFVEKKASTGSATQYEILTTKVRISTIENQKTDLLTNLETQQSLLASYLGINQNEVVKLKKDLYSTQLMPDNNELIEKAMNQRYEVKINKQRNLVSESKIQTIDAVNKPLLNAFATAGFKNGYLPNYDNFKANYVVGVGFKFPILDGKRSKYNKALAKNEQLEIGQDADLTRRNITNEVISCKANLTASAKKISQSELQYKQSQQAYSLAETSYKAGVITNLDLLDASQNLSESSLSVTQAHINYTVNLLKLKIALGEKIY